MRDLMGEPVGSYRTVEQFAVVVPKEPRCANPNCRLLHYMAALVPGVCGFHAVGELFEVDADTLAVIDSLEIGGDGARVYEKVEIEVASLDGDVSRSGVVAYQVLDPPAWIALANRGGADLLDYYGIDYAKGWTLKDCCVRDPDHHGPHDVLDPLGSGRRCG
jgi:hypothetical protein